MGRAARVPKLCETCVPPRAFTIAVIFLPSRDLPVPSTGPGEPSHPRLVSDMWSPSLMTRTRPPKRAPRSRPASTRLAQSRVGTERETRQRRHDRRGGPAAWDQAGVRKRGRIEWPCPIWFMWAPGRVLVTCITLRTAAKAATDSIGPPQGTLFPAPCG